jgi:hypothetical protein
LNGRGRRAVALWVVLASLVVLRLLVPEPALRREAMLLVMIPLGYGHVLGALCMGKGRARRVGRFGGAAIGVIGLLWTPVGAAPLTLLLAAFAVWHVVENDFADVGAGRLPPLPGCLRRQLGPLLVSACLVAVAAVTPWLTHPALRVGVPHGFAAWTAEEVFAAVLYYHVVAFALRAARPGHRFPVFAFHAVPLVLALAGALVWPTAHVLATAPLPYLVSSVAHALHTAWERGVARPG